MGAETRRHLLDVGLDTVRAGGYARVSIQDIVAAAGVPKGSFHYYFPSKEAFALALMKHFAGRMAPVAATLEADSDAPAVERLRRFFRAYAARMDAEGFRTGCLFGVLALDAGAVGPVVRDRIDAGLAAFAAALAPHVRAARDEGSLAQDTDPDALAAFLVDAWQGALLRMRVERSGAPLQRFERVVFDALFGPPQ